MQFPVVIRQRLKKSVILPHARYREDQSGFQLGDYVKRMSISYEYYNVFKRFFLHRFSLEYKAKKYRRFLIAVVNRTVRKIS